MPNKGLTEKSIAVMANSLIESLPSLSIQANRVFWTMLGLINKDDKDFEIYEIPIETITDFWNVKSEGIYYYMKKAVDEMLKTVVNLPTDNGFEKCSLISWGKYINGEAKLRVRFDPVMRPYLLELKGRYSKLQIKYMARLDAGGASMSAIRIYELCHSHLLDGKTKGECSYSVPELREKIGLGSKYSKNNGDFRTKVLDIAVKKIAECSDITIAYDMTGRGQKAVVHFLVVRKENPDDDYQITEDQEHPKAEDSDAVRSTGADKINPVTETVTGSGITADRGNDDIYNAVSQKIGKRLSKHAKETYIDPALSAGLTLADIMEAIDTTTADKGKLHWGYFGGILKNKAEDLKVQASGQYRAPRGRTVVPASNSGPDVDTSWHDNQEPIYAKDVPALSEEELMEFLNNT